jgi:hypothetical protein
MGAGQLQVATSLAGLVTVVTAVDVSAVAMPLQLGFGEVSLKMIVEGAGRFQFHRAALGTLLGMDIVFDEHRTGRRLGPKGTRVLAMLLAAAVGRRARLARPRRTCPLAALVDLLELVFHLRQAVPQLGVFRFEFGNAIQELLPVVHDPHS